MTHELKTLPAYWDAVQRGEKAVEVRRDDRGFQKGDILELVKLSRPPFGSWDIEYDYHGKRSSPVLRREIGYILTGGQLGIEPGYVVMALKEAT